MNGETNYFVGRVRANVPKINEGHCSLCDGWIDSSGRNVEQWKLQWLGWLDRFSSIKSHRLNQISSYFKEEEPSRGPNRKLGQTSYFCPVAYRDQRVLKPGDPEIVASFKGLAYYFGGEAEMAKFMQNPEKYVDDGIQYPLKVS